MKTKVLVPQDEVNCGLEKWKPGLSPMKDNVWWHIFF